MLTAWDWVDRTATIIGLLTFLLSTMTWFQVRRLRKRWSEQARKVTSGPNAQPGILVINVGMEPIVGQVRRFADQQEWAKGRIDQIPLEEVHWDRDLLPEELDDLLDKVRHARAMLQSKGCDSLHLFMRAPLVVGLTVGAELGNGIPTFLYHQDKRTGYVPWGYLYRRRGLQ